jgi:hypothetical protein
MIHPLLEGYSSFVKNDAVLIATLLIDLECRIVLGHGGRS